MRLQQEETDSVVELSRLTLMLIAGLVVEITTGIAVVETKPLEAAAKGVLITAVTLAAVNLLGYVLMFITKGGAVSHYSYLSVLAILLYIHALLGVYSACALLYMASSSRKVVPMFRVNAVLYGAGSTVCLLATLQLPRFVTFLKDFRNNTRSNRVFLPEYIFHPESAPYENHAETLSFNYKVELS